jgi:hypothetical protein
MREVQIYIETTANTFERLELFNDEKISINLSVQNVQDIAKIFTEFTQSFTIPASSHNNAIFQHFYENAVDGTIDHQIRRPSRIEIDLIPFRTGKIQIEKSNLKKGLVESYTITFFGDMISLKDLFGEEKLEVLDMNAYTHLYTGSEIQTRITSNSDYDLRWPLISSSRYWVYGGGGQQDISQNSHHIHHTELTPAIKVQKIFEAIQNRYGITWDSLFFSDKRFLNLFLWLKNRETLNTEGELKNVDITGVGVGVVFGNTSSISDFVDTVNNKIVVDPNHPANVQWKSEFVSVKVWGVPSQSTHKWYLYTYRNGILIQTQEATGATITSIQYERNNTYKEYTYKAQCISGNIQLFCRIELGGSTLRAVQEPTMATNSYSGKFNISANMPDMKIYDFVSGIFKQFNLTCTPINASTFKVETLETYYTLGRIIDVTKHIDVDSIDIERVKLYKKILFKHQQSDTIGNYGFRGNFPREYGDLEQQWNYDGSEYTIELPFETMFHNKFTSTDLQVGYSLDKDRNPIITKPLLLYMNDRQTSSFYFNNGSSTVHITDYMPFGQDLIYNGNKYSLNFGWDTSTFYLEPLNLNIYHIYYNNYLSNLYNPKQRLTYVKGNFPTAILTSLELNDRLIIRDKRYIINDIKTDLTTGEVNLVLLHDFRVLEQAFSLPETPVGTDNVFLNIGWMEGATTATINTGTSGLTATPSTIIEAQVVEIDYPIVDLGYAFGLENGDLLISEDYAVIATENWGSVYYDVVIDYTLSDGSIESLPINLNQSTSVPYYEGPV